jgi:uncharacterized protein YggU (UPF0235/DUF167 family)
VAKARSVDANVSARTHWPCLTVSGDCAQLAVSVVPNARWTGCDGLHDGALRVRLCAPPTDGRANAALVAWLAAEIGCPKRALSLVRGRSTRLKTLRVEGVWADHMAAWLARILTRASAD